MYVLSAQLDDERAHGEAPGTAWRRYQAYLAREAHRLPPGARAHTESNWFANWSDHRALHDAWLEWATLIETPREGAERRTPRGLELRVRLLGAYHDGWIELRYPEVTRYELHHASGDVEATGHQDWRYDEFRLTATGRLEHEIEWSGMGDSGRWLIEASDFEHRWIPMDAAPRADQSATD